MKEYRIKEGEYSSGFHFGIHLGKTSEKYKVRFSKECLYNKLDWENDYNKLVGWSYLDHRKNSIRIGWRVNNDKIELCIYIHEHGLIKTVNTALDKLMLLEVDKEYTLTLDHFPNNGIVMLSNLGKEFGDDTPLSLYSTLDAKPRIGYNLYPYFGGSNPSPHDMTIELERL